ncbi:MAG: succinate dehydrogenase cytochrome b subunit [Gemmatimonadaceae bacterium]|nr:succinate dehydrogenase cytochrome b subunit [Polyangiaceae bacterium]NUQ11143.1 succinate dehydrogenase cytochrome b subunit [Gemmatimonadaceae bacterium]
MSSTAPAATQRITLFYQDYVGKKVAMALSGVVLFGYVIIHMAGNLQIFAGREQLNAYAQALHANVPLLWIARIVLLLAVGIHFYTGISLAGASRAARPVRYQVKGQRHPNLAGRTMALSGLVLAAFIVFHILHLTTGTVQPAPFADLRPYDNMVNSFRVIPVAGFYVLSVCLLGLHLYHGAWSMFQSVGFNHPRYTPALRRFAAVFAFLLAIGFSVVPIAVLTGMVR